MPLQRRVPKRGFNNIFAKQYTSVNVEALNRFEDGQVITAETLRDAGIIKRNRMGSKYSAEARSTRS